MPRSISTAMADKAAERAVSPLFFVNLDIVGDPVWACTAQQSLTLTVADDPLLASGQAFLGVAGIGGISDIVQGADGSIAEVALTLMYADFTDEAASDLINDPSQWSQRRGVVWAGFYEEATGTVVEDPVRMITGRITHVGATDGQSPSIVVKVAAKAAADGQRTSAWMLGDAHQQTFYPGDKALEFVPQLPGAAINFGVADTTTRAAAAGAGSGSSGRFEAREL